MTKYVVAPLSTTLSNSAAATINENLNRISTALEKTLSRDGEIPNQLTADLDMNNSDIHNVQILDAEVIVLDGVVLVPGGVTAIPPGSIGTGALADGSVTASKIADGNVTNEKLADAGLVAIANLVTSADMVPYSTGVDTWAMTGLTSFGRSLINDGSASNARTTLGVTIGLDVQAFDAGLSSIAGLTTSADKMIYTTGTDAYNTTDLSSFARTLLDDADATTARATLGSVIGTNVQAFDAGLQSISGLTTAANTMIYTTALDTYTTTPLTAFARTLLDDADAVTARGTLGVFQALVGTTTYDPPSLADGAGASQTVTVTGAALGDVAVASFSLSTQGITVTANVTAADTVTVRFQNETTGVIDLASGTLKAVVFK